MKQRRLDPKNRLSEQFKTAGSEAIAKTRQWRRPEAKSLAETMDQVRSQSAQWHCDHASVDRSACPQLRSRRIAVIIAALLIEVMRQSVGAVIEVVRRG
jgi:hypothetical protein